MGLSVFYQASEAFTAIYMWIKANKNSIIKVTECIAESPLIYLCGDVRRAHWL